MSKVKKLDENGRVVLFGEAADADTVTQINNCVAAPSAVKGVLCADNHRGYNMPVGGVLAYSRHISPAGVGYDIGCGNKAVRTPVLYEDIRKDISKIMDNLFKAVSFGIGRKQDKPVDHELFDDPLFTEMKDIGKLKDLAQIQLGTVGSGNHYVDILVEDSTGLVWIANHFGSRGFGHKVASGFLNLSEGIGFAERGRSENDMLPPVVLSLDSPLGEDYWRAMELAGKYAYAGRDYVVDQVLGILRTHSTKEVHNNHNFAWKEMHGENELVVVRKGATPLAPGQEGFVGGNMCDICVVVEGIDSDDAKEGLYSAMHGAGRVMGRMQAKGKWKYIKDESGRKKLTQVRAGMVSPEMMKEAIAKSGVELRGAGLDESPFCYKKLQDVIDAHDSALKVNHVLRPIGVAMAESEELDPYKD